MEHTKCGAVFLVYRKTPVLSFFGMKKPGKHGIMRDDYVCTIQGILKKKQDKNIRKYEKNGSRLQTVSVFFVVKEQSSSYNRLVRRRKDI